MPDIVVPNVHRLITFCQETPVYMGPVTGVRDGADSGDREQKGVKLAHLEQKVIKTQVKPVGREGVLLARVPEVYPIFHHIYAQNGQER